MITKILLMNESCSACFYDGIAWKFWSPAEELCLDIVASHSCTTVIIIQLTHLAVP
jgi:hypothetical protein